ncbi:MAG: hypothetical protein PHW24_01265 [Candidatus Moranbacteria bacterium]|nr:hypothetical protein [Candidatus Moranbacteria bacterium]
MKFKDLKLGALFVPVRNIDPERIRNVEELTKKKLKSIGVFQKIRTKEPDGTSLDTALYLPNHTVMVRDYDPETIVYKIDLG